MKNMDFRKRLGLQFFAEGDGGGEDSAGVGAGDDGAAGAAEDDFMAGLLGKDASEDDPAGEGGAAEGEEDTPPEDDQPENEPEEDEPGAGGGEGGEQEGEAPAGDAGGQPSRPQMVALNVGGRSVQVPAEAMHALSGALGADAAQVLAQGMAYGQRQTPEMRVLDSYAQAAGVSTEEYVAFLEREQQGHLVAAEVEAIRARYPEGTPDEALQAIAGRNVADRNAEAERQRQAEAARQSQMQQNANTQRIMQETGELFRLYPEIKGKDDVPQGVWDLVKNDKITLPVAYERYQAQQVRAELAEAREQIKAAQKQNGNRAQAVGSMSGQGDEGKDEFLSILLS